MNVTVCDVGPRDGLQNYRDVLSASTRAELCDRLSGTGLPRIEVGSFVSPSKVPQMAGAEEVFEALHRRDGVIYAALALNLRGVQRALDAGVEELHMAYPLSDTFGQRNQGMTLAEAAQTTEAMVRRAREAGVWTSVTLAAAFGCPFEGPVDPGVVSDHVARMAAAGADEIMLADSIGVGVPAQVRRLVPDAIAQAGGRPVGLHLHNTRNNGYANALAGLEQGVTILDASIGGLGGCPFAPRATGNIATEDLLYLLDGEGVDTGVDLDELIATAEWLAAQLGAELPGLVYKAGPFVPVSA